MSTDTNDTTEDDDDLMLRAGAEVELPDVSVHGYALIMAGLEELKSSPDCTRPMYEDTEALQERLNNHVGTRNEKAAGEVLSVLDRLDTTPGVAPGGADGE